MNPWKINIFVGFSSALSGICVAMPCCWVVQHWDPFLVLKLHKLVPWSAISLLIWNKFHSQSYIVHINNIPQFSSSRGKIITTNRNQNRFIGIESNTQIIFYQNVWFDFVAVSQLQASLHILLGIFLNARLWRDVLWYSVVRLSFFLSVRLYEPCRLNR